MKLLQKMFLTGSSQATSSLQSALLAPFSGAPAANGYITAPSTARSAALAGVWSVALMSVLALGVLLSAQSVRAQLPVGGFLGPDPAEEEVEERIQEQIQKQVEIGVEDGIEDSVEFATEQNIQETIEDTIEETIEQTVDATVEDTVDDAVAGAVEDSIEERVEASVADTVEDDIAEELASVVEEGVESDVEESVEFSIEASVEDSVEASVEEAVASAVEGNVESTVESSVESAVEDSVAQSIEASVETSVEESVAEAVEESVAENVEESVASNVESAVQSSVEDDVELRVVSAIEERLETEIDDIVEGLESALEVDERRILKEQWLVMAEPSVFDELSNKGYLFDTVTELPGLGLRLAEVAAPSTFDITDVRNGVLDVVGKDRAEVDLNHIYTAGVPEMVAGDGTMPRIAMPFPTDLDSLNLRVGMIDSNVDISHPALLKSRIQTRSFARPGSAAPDFHGTAIASIIAANSDEYQGLAPNAELFAASVFELDGDRGEIASTVSLIRALDWLISSGVDVVNISLAGPPNRLLERALDRAASQEMVIMAAAGNGGPVARPMYPAAYSSVVAVTAVDSARHVFRLANRGEYLALAAPGVDLRHAQPGGGYAASSGTSFAVPFAVTAAARLRHLQPGGDIIAMLLESAMDLGPPGRDTIYGYGLLTLGSL